MSERKFNIVFDGSVINGSDPSEVKASVKQLFKLDDASAEKLFTGKPIVIKKNIDRKAAIQFQNAMTKAGARVQLVMHKEKVVDDPSASRASEHPKPESNKPASQTAQSSDATLSTTENSASGWTLASPGSVLSESKEQATGSPVNTDHIQLEKSSGNPFLDQLDASEKTVHRDNSPTYPEPNVETTANFELKSEQQILSETQSRVAEIDRLIEQQQRNHQNDFDVADAGTDLLLADEKTQFEEIDIDLSHLQVEAQT